MRAILLAAGRGLRMDEYGVAKPLLYLREGETILGRLVGQVTALGFDPVIVVGYDPQRFMQAFWNKATFAYYPTYTTTGPLNALLTVSQFVRDESLLVAYADTVTDDATLKSVVAQPDSVAVIPHDGYGPRFHAEDGVVTKIYSSEEEGGAWASSGFAYLSKNVLEKIEQVPGFEHRTIGFALKGCRAVVGRAINVNTADDLERARKEFT